MTMTDQAANQDVKQQIKEPIKVLASFAPQKIQIHFFSWRERTYKVESMNLFHIGKDGDKKLYNFAVSADGNSYQLTFNPVTLEWELEDVVSY